MSNTDKTIPRTIEVNKPGNDAAAPASHLHVCITCDAVTETSGLIIPQGTTGRILDYTDRGFLIDFGLPAVCVLPADSPLFEFVDREVTL